MQQLNIHAVGWELQVAHHRSSDEAVPDRLLQQTPQSFTSKCIQGNDAADSFHMSIQDILLYMCRDAAQLRGWLTMWGYSCSLITRML